jgi:hypothetical protein
MSEVRIRQLRHQKWQEENPFNSVICHQLRPSYYSAPLSNNGGAGARIKGNIQDKRGDDDIQDCTS